MSDVALYLSAVLLAAVVVYVLSPLVDGPRDLAAAAGSEVARAEALLAQKAMVYQSIRDAELDRQTGKLSDEDADLLVTELKGKAVAILKELDRLDSSTAATLKRGAKG